MLERVERLEHALQAMHARLLVHLASEWAHMFHRKPTRFVHEQDTRIFSAFEFDIRDRSQNILDIVLD